MEIFLNGPGGCMSTWDLTKSSYDWWKDKSKKFIFDYVWNFNSQGFNNDNMFHREMLDVPLKVSFLSKAPDWMTNPDQQKNLNVCDYNNSVIFVEVDNRITMHYPDELVSVEYDGEYKNDSTIFFSGISCEIGNWQHKKYKKFISLDELNLYVKKINGRKWIFDFDFEENRKWEVYNVHNNPFEWYYRIHVRNKNVVEDLSTFTNIDLSYNMNSGIMHQENLDVLDTSNFKFHNYD